MITQKDAPPAAPRSGCGSPELARHIRALVDEAPPLSAEQRNRLAVLLRPAVVEHLAAAS